MVSAAYAYTHNNTCIPVHISKKITHSNACISVRVSVNMSAPEQLDLKLWRDGHADVVRVLPAGPPLDTSLLYPIDQSFHCSSRPMRAMAFSKFQCLFQCLFRGGHGPSWICGGSPCAAWNHIVMPRSAASRRPRTEGPHAEGQEFRPGAFSESTAPMNLPGDHLVDLGRHWLEI